MNEDLDQDSVYCDNMANSSIKNRVFSIFLTCLAT
jgi:hypothetical protein